MPLLLACTLVVGCLTHAPQLVLSASTAAGRSSARSSTALETDTRPAGLLQNATWPLAYIQSAFVTGQPGAWSGQSLLSRTDRLERLRKYADPSVTSFHGGEMFINTMETPQALSDVREMNELILQVASETGTPPFHGFWIPSRLPGMWWPANYSSQPASYRAVGLRSDGVAMTYYPTQPLPDTSILNVQGTDIDITNAEAVELAMANLGRVMRADCQPKTECVGPLVGSFLFSEAALTPTYRPFATFPYTNQSAFAVGNQSDLHPAGNHTDGAYPGKPKPPMLRMGDPWKLYVCVVTCRVFYSSSVHLECIEGLTKKQWIEQVRG